MSGTHKNTLLQVSGLSIGFSQYMKGTQKRIVRPISGLHVDIGEGEIVAVVGASGSGKSLLAHAVLGILPGNAICSGSIVYKGEELTQTRKEQLRGREIAFIPQSVNYLDPLMSVGRQVRIGLDRATAKAQQEKLFAQYGLKKSDGRLLPFELSGGMLRRVLFATSVREGVKLVIADEPTPGIHPQALSEILKQLKQFAENGAGVMLITHDIMSALEIADRVAVIKDGATVEISEVSAFTGKGEALKTEYTQRLWRTLPQNDFDLEFQEEGGRATWR
ncbi:peptide/nickel transport system ATP-binding protein [Paenibacillus sp. UNCCL117]|uniref:ATP-binding cassette domain-containing protein n=1 Tax=unclassified Paenibacillus TaxID=185978 RepID=UPI00088588A1|nr:MULTISPECIES: ATP-binding cassette domain-containing protein [unclassified Paenibacillus]SDD96493.1 peptide/nickel transport system ATP-binding protein [Paenibacillus sp. cl123]SFW56375.1 peptide/nickel transport system ATP-binding protein [Paenibacillus sp. UNCCL117]